MFDAKDLIPLLVALLTVGGTIGMGLLSKQSRSSRFFSEEKSRLELVELAKKLDLDQNYSKRADKPSGFFYIFGISWLVILFLAIYIIISSIISSQRQIAEAERIGRIQSSILAKREEIGMLWSDINKRAEFLNGYCNRQEIHNDKLQTACTIATDIWSASEFNEIGNREAEIQRLYKTLNKNPYEY